MKLRDQQRSKLYAWETRECDARRTSDNCEPLMELREIKKLVTKVARDYGLTKRKVRVKDGRGRRIACYSHYERAIKLPLWARRPVVVLHELAHWITRVMWGEDYAAHGREFTGIFMELLRRYNGEDLVAMQESANKVRLDFIPNSQSTARSLKKKWPWVMGGPYSNR